nr:MAG TPA: hypothetical protein [Caudoviricetes sp.]
MILSNFYPIHLFRGSREKSDGSVSSKAGE